MKGARAAMAVGFPRAAVIDDRPDRLPRAAGVVADVMRRLGQLLCGVQGHDHLVQFEERRMFLRCISCGHESAGWDMPRTSIGRAITPMKARIVQPVNGRKAA